MSLVCLNLSESVVPHIAERLCPCRYFTIVFAFCEVAQRKQKGVVCLMGNQWSLNYPAFGNGFERSTT